MESTSLSGGHMGSQFCDGTTQDFVPGFSDSEYQRFCHNPNKDGFVSGHTDPVTGLRNTLANCPLITGTTSYWVL